MRGLVVYIGIFGICSSLPAWADSDWYIGGAIGSGIVQSGSTDLNTTLAAQGITAQSTLSCKCTDYKLYAGYNLNEHFAIEGGYVNLGKLNASGTFTAPLPGGIFSDDIKAEGWNMDLVGIIPVMENFSAYGRLGLIRAEARSNVVASTGFFTLAFPSKATNTTTHYSAGFKYNFTRSWGIRGEWEKFTKIGNPNTTGQADIDLYSMGFIYQF